MQSQKPIVRAGFLASHGGTAFRHIMESRESSSVFVEPTVLITNNLDAAALAVAGKYGVPSYVINANTTDPSLIDHEICRRLVEHDTELVVLAGFMKKIGAETLNKFTGRIINSHPALLPKFGGQGMYGRRVHNAVVEAGETHSGVTVHIVDKEYDTGPMLYQTSIPLSKMETPESLEEKIKTLEPDAYLKAIEKLVSTREWDLREITV